MNTVIYNVSGVNNSQMKTALKNALDKLDGVQAIDVDMTLKTVEIGYNSPADEMQIRDCILESGFKLI